MNDQTRFDPRHGFVDPYETLDFHGTRIRLLRDASQIRRALIALPDVCRAAGISNIASLQERIQATARWKGRHFLREVPDPRNRGQVTCMIELGILGPVVYSVQAERIKDPRKREQLQRVQEHLDNRITEYLLSEPGHAVARELFPDLGDLITHATATETLDPPDHALEEFLDDQTLPLFEPTPQEINDVRPVPDDIPPPILTRLDNLDDHVSDIRSVLQLLHQNMALIAKYENLRNLDIRRLLSVAQVDPPPNPKLVWRSVFMPNGRTKVILNQPDLFRPPLPEPDADDLPAPRPAEFDHAGHVLMGQPHPACAYCRRGDYLL